MPIGSNLSVTLPTTEDTFVDIVAKLSAAIELLAEVLEAPIDSGSLDITTALTLNGAPIINVGGLRLVGGLSTQPGTMYIDSSGELHVVTTVGDIQITSNGDLNVAALGTIGGDYGGGNPATVTFDDTSGEYRFQEDTNDWATIVAETFIAKVNGGAGSISFGALSSITTARDFKIKSLPASGVSGLAYEASSGGVVDANQTRETLTHKFTNIDITGEIFRGEQTQVIPFGPAQLGGATSLLAQDPTFGGSGAAVAWVLPASNNVVQGIKHSLPVGTRIKSVYIQGTSGVAASSIQLWKQNYDSGTNVAVTLTGGFHTVGYVNIAINTPFELAANEQLIIKVAAGAADIKLTHIAIVSDVIA